MLQLRRREIPWEVVDNKTVDLVSMYDDNEDLKLVTMKGVNVRRKFLLDVRQDARLKVELRKAVTFAREQLLQEIRRNGYNILLFESWQVTLLRKGGLYRIEVEYTGRPASATNAIPRRHPPYMAVLQHVMGLSSETSSEKQDDNKLLHVVGLSTETSSEKQDDNKLLRVISRRISRCSSFLRPQCNV